MGSFRLSIGFLYIKNIDLFVSCLTCKEFPPKSKLDPQAYGNQNSTITAQHIEDKLDGLSIDEVIHLLEIPH